MIWLKPALALLLAGAGAAGVLSYTHLARKAATADQRIAAAEAQARENARAIDTLRAETVRRAEFDAAIRAARQATTERVDHAVETDPVARDYLGERIPDSVRDAYLGRDVR